jgi:ureidoacrylate peracid hydrolase
VGGFAQRQAYPPGRADTKLIDGGISMEMNGVTIPEAIMQRVIERRGTDHSFADLDPLHTALVVIDLQHAFMNDAVGFAAVPAARDIVPAVNRLAAAVRETGGGVFWIKMTHDERCFSEWSVAYELLTPEVRARRIAALSEGTLGHELWPDLDVRPEDEMVKKYRYSAFMPGTSELPDRLRSRGFDTVLITGIVTNVCCESSARDANMTDFRTIMVSDGNAALSQAEHDASLTAFYNTFGDVMDTDMIVAGLRRLRSARAA